jgi:hypothetical protein
LNAKKDKRDIERILILQSESNIEDYMIQKPYYNIKLDSKGIALVGQIALSLHSCLKAIAQ